MLKFMFLIGPNHVHNESPFDVTECSKWISHAVDIREYPKAILNVHGVSIGYTGLYWVSSMDFK